MDEKTPEPIRGHVSHPSTMPVLFVGHGSPMNAIEDNEFSRGFIEVGKKLPRPKAILCVSAHWETQGTQVTAMDKPRTIHDFGGFPRALYDVQYPAPGSPWLAQKVKDAVKKTQVQFDQEWGLDHGCWSVLIHLFPEADVPVVQLSLDFTQPAQYHYELGNELSSLRRKGVLIIGSGNMVHNLGRIVFSGGHPGDFNYAYALPWAREAGDLFKKLIDEGRYNELADYRRLGSAVQLAVPTPEHFLPLLYVLALKQEGDALSYFNDKPVAGSLTMTSILIDSA